jgi:K+-sensing histidine kinase KdpD
VSTHDQSARDRIRREARVVGLRGFSTPSLEAVERRRLQLWVLAAFLLVSVTVGAVVLSLWPGEPANVLLTLPVLRISILLLAVAFCAYAIEQELHLRRLAKLLMDERVLTTALSNRLHEVSLLLDAGKAMNAVLELPIVLETILSSATELLEATSGSVMLVEGDELVASCVRGNAFAEGQRVRVGEGIAGHVARVRDSILIDGRADPDDFPGLVARELPVESAMSVPLISRGELLGVLNVNASAERLFSEFDLRALSLFAEQGAAAISNARLFENERSHVLELLQLDRLKSDFVALVSHELRTPITSIVAAASTAKRPEMKDSRDELIDVMERQAKRLASMVEDLLSASKLEHEVTLPKTEEVDLVATVRLAAADTALVGRKVDTELPEHAVVLGDHECMRRVVDNLIDNAFKYGAEPVKVVIERQPLRIVLSVVDGGPGVPENDRERIFGRFHRLERDRGESGLGLGLPIVRGLIEAAHGEVWIEDAPGGGAAFRVSLPSYEAAQVAV